MEANRPVVISIAGFDPCGGAGILADIKTFEQFKVYGLGISSAQTLQTENDFISIRWEAENDILQALETMLVHYDVKAVKIGIVENISTLNRIVAFIHQKDVAIKIIIDTVIKSSSGFDFWNEKTNETQLFETLSKSFLITPNYNEVLQLMPADNSKDAAQKLSAWCNVLLKGGHNKDEVGVDYLYTENNIKKLVATTTTANVKHGSGCVLSAAITANLGLDYDLVTSCTNAKKYIEQFLESNNTLLGYHYV
jgi:hydroxymethylpyrimidine/phosphomethylpyrimidine kinase